MACLIGNSKQEGETASGPFKRERISIYGPKSTAADAEVNVNVEDAPK